ncbi:MAG: hypothetical protein H7836_02170 [Magnetococcus sp. YQC-3]
MLFQKVEEYRVRELATKGDLAAAKVDIIKWVVTTSIVILRGVAASNRIFPPVPAYYQPPVQEMRQPAPPPVATVPAQPLPAR